MSNQKTKINEQNYPVLREIYNIQQLQQDSDVDNHKHLDFLTLKHSSSYDFVQTIRKNLTTLFYLHKKDVEVDYLVYKLFAKLDLDQKFRTKCFEQAFLIPDDAKGCLLLPNSNKAIIYNVSPANEGKNGRKQLIVYFISANKIDSFELVEICENNRVYTEEQYNIYSLKSSPALTTAYYIIAYLIFKHYATIETVPMQKGKTRKSTTTLNNESFEVENRMLIPVNIIDSSWFRTIKGDGFTVSGHLRFQYYASTKTHKWISIDPYEKSGYTRKAKGEDY